MDCTSNNSATLKQDVNRNNADDVEQQINKQGEDEQQQVKQPAITTMMVVNNKGKRTKRQRLHHADSSPINSSSTNGHQQQDDLVIDNDDEEQLDMAKCLILLAQGQSRPSSSPSIPGDPSSQMSGKKRRRSYSSSSLSLGVYACHICNRTFQSFQALGGHRASHKKLNITTSSTANSHHDYLVNPLSLQLGNINYSRAEAPPNPIPTTSAVVNAQIPNINNNNNNKKSRNKVHECTICGADFSSGQALGGHMRRHRGPVVPLTHSATVTVTTTTTAANTTLSFCTTANVSVDAAGGKVIDPVNNNDSYLSLDLNLPASPSPKLDTKFCLHPKQQSAAMALSTVVECFY